MRARHKLKIRQARKPEKFDGKNDKNEIVLTGSQPEMLAHYNPFNQNGEVKL